MTDTRSGGDSPETEGPTGETYAETGVTAGGDQLGGGSYLGVDIGGTFTDVVIIEDGRLTVEKVPSTPDAPEKGVLDGVTAIDIPLDDVLFLAHGTTVTTNAVLERDWAETALVTTEGFRDVLEIARQDRPALYDLRAEKPTPVVPRDRRFEVPERLDDRGNVLEELDEGAVEKLSTRIDADSVAVTLLFAYENPDHEKQVQDILDRELDATVSISAAVLPEIREYERTLVTCLNAALRPIVDSYLGELMNDLREKDVTAPVRVMGSNGGVMQVAEARKRPVTTLLSGPAAGVRGAAYVAARTGFDHVMTMDMGGTSCDVSLVREGDPLVSTGVEVGEYPIAIPMVDVHSVGAGGGSIVDIDPGGAIRVGPRSAGADPGPACYGRGGERPTITDAHAVLGRIDPASILPQGDAGLAWSVIEPVADELGTSVANAAAGVLRVANANVVRALRVVSVERGYDPRNFALASFGGAGPLHAAAVGDSLNVSGVIIPRAAGVLSALGLVVADMVADESTTMVRPWNDVDPDALTDTFAKLETRALDRLGGSQHENMQQGENGFKLERAVDIRYAGQSFDLRVLADDIDAVPRRFHERHATRYGHASPEEPIELVTVRVRAKRIVDPPDLATVIPEGNVADARRGHRPIRFGEAFYDTPVYARQHLPANGSFEGPAVVEGSGNTAIVRPEDSVQVDCDGNIRIQVGE